MLYVADTHSLIWFLSDPKKLGKNASKIFDKAEEGRCVIVIPTIVLAEIMYISEKKKANIKFMDILRKLQNSLNYVVYNLDLEVLIKSKDLIKINELHDRIIIATAQIIGAKILTRDENITTSAYAEVVW